MCEHEHVFPVPELVWRRRDLLSVPADLHLVPADLHVFGDLHVP